MKKILIAATAAVLWSGVAAAAPVPYTIETSHTFASFEAPHMGVSMWRGKFNVTKGGKVVLDDAAKTGSVEVTIDAATADVGNDKLNEELASDMFFDAKQFPEVTYKGTIHYKNGKPASVDGQLTLHGVTKPVKLTIKSFACIEHPFFKKQDCGVDAYGSFNRSDFGVSKYADGPLGKVNVEIQAEALKDG